MTDEIAELQALAEKATPGPWAIEGVSETGGSIVNRECDDAAMWDIGTIYAAPNLAYIAACSPDRIQRVLARLRKCEEALEHIAMGSKELWVVTCARAALEPGP